METAILICVIAMAVTNCAALYLVYLKYKPAAEKPQEIVETPIELTEEEKKKQADAQKRWDDGVDNLLNYQPMREGNE
jgi:cell division protein FtsX